jgi:hypothetical protein
MFGHEIDVDEGIFASRSQLALQDLLTDVAAVVGPPDSTEPRTSSVDLTDALVECQICLTAGIIEGMRRSAKMNAFEDRRREK